jgi:hypothetical protein
LINRRFGRAEPPRPPNPPRRAFICAALVAEFTPLGPLEEDIVSEIARLTWRKQNLATFRIAELAQKRYEKICSEKVPFIHLFPKSDKDVAEQKARQKGYRVAKEQARQELGDTYELIDIGEPATLDGLMKELAIKDRLDGLISKCLKQLLMVRGVKSLALASSSRSTPQISPVSTPQIAGTRKAG